MNLQVFYVGMVCGWISVAILLYFCPMHRWGARRSLRPWPRPRQDQRTDEMNTPESTLPDASWRIIPKEYLEAGNPLPGDGIVYDEGCGWEDSSYQGRRLPHYQLTNTYATRENLPCFEQKGGDEPCRKPETHSSSPVSNAPTNVPSVSQGQKPAAVEHLTCDGREFAGPLDAALHLLWLIQRLCHYEPDCVGKPADGPRFREAIVESRKLLTKLNRTP